MARVAVIGVHGVADQKPGETARAVARTLQAESAATGSTYEGFVEERLSLPVKKLHLGEPPSQRRLPARLQETRSFDERTPYLRWLHAQRGPTEQLVRDVEADAAIEFMYDQVYFYDPRHSQQPDRWNSTYDTVRLRGRRLKPKNNAAPNPTSSDEVAADDIDIYEFHWADLSRLQNGVLHVLTAFYQLLFHVCSLGRDTLDLAEPESRAAGVLRRWQWSALRSCHAVVSACLSMAIPVLNLCLLGVLLIVLPAKVPTAMEPAAVAAGACAVIIAGGFIGRLFRAARPDQPPGRYGAILAAAVLAICGMVYSPELTGAILSRNGFEAVAWKKVLVVEWGLLSSALIGAILLAYKNRKPMVLVVGPLLWLPSAAAVAWMVHRAEPTEVGLAQAAIGSSVLLLLALHFFWAVMALALIAAGTLTCGSWLRRDTGSRIDRALATGFVSMIGPVTLFAFVTLAIYSPMLSLADVSFLRLPDARLQLLVLGHSIPGLQGASLQDAVHWMFQLSVTWLSDGILLVWGAAAFLILCEFFWPVWAESMRPTSRPADRSRFMGESLTHAFGSLGFAFGILYFAFPFVFLAGAALNWLLWLKGMPPARPSGIFPLLGALVFGLAATGKLGVVLDKVWPALDVILDVDNYLQGRPWDCNPKGRIATRYVALLRFLAQQHYDRVVIVAHSQGTVITTDLLRFLRVNSDPALSTLGFERPRTPDEPHPFPIVLVTMGCPLRQLYGWRFPHLYHWSRHEGTTDGAATAWQQIGPDCRPDPRALGVVSWVNAYNSGDYVGRHIWRDDNLARPAANSETLFTPWNHAPAHESHDTAHLRRELCYGAGAHTHYFEDNATDLARLVDALIEPGSSSTGERPA